MCSNSVEYIYFRIVGELNRILFVEISFMVTKSYKWAKLFLILFPKIMMKKYLKYFDTFSVAF